MALTIAVSTASAPVVTKIESGAFFEAEAEHQDFARRNPNHGYIVRWDAPKLAAFKRLFPAMVRATRSIRV